MLNIRQFYISDFLRDLNLLNFIYFSNNLYNFFSVFKLSYFSLFITFKAILYFTPKFLGIFILLII